MRAKLPTKPQAMNAPQITESKPNRHPNHLKVRLFGATPDSRYVQDAKAPLPLGPDLLQDLSALYQA